MFSGYVTLKWKWFISAVESAEENKIKSLSAGEEFLRANFVPTFTMSTTVFFFFRR